MHTHRVTRIIRYVGLTLMVLALTSNALNTCTPYVRLFIWCVLILGAAIYLSSLI